MRGRLDIMNFQGRVIFPFYQDLRQTASSVALLSSGWIFSLAYIFIEGIFLQVTQLSIGIYRNLRFDLSLWSRLKSFSSFQVLTVETWTSRIVLSRDAPWADCNFNTCLHSVSCSFRLLFFFFLILKPVIFSYFFVSHLCSLKSICFILSRISQGL